MMKKYSVQPILRALVLSALLMLLFSACAGGKASLRNPRLFVDSPQEAVYNGQAQAISVRYTGEKAPEILYYPSPEARKEGRAGSSGAPVRAGTYYVRVRYPGGNGHGPAEEVLAELRIHKRPVKIQAEEVQAAYYNGDPKRVLARAQPHVPLSYSYYPNRELRETAQRTEREAATANSGRAPSGTFSGYRRVERAPVEQGTYYVWVYFPGDDNHEPAHADVEFTILPPRRP